MKKQAFLPKMNFGSRIKYHVLYWVFYILFFTMQRSALTGYSEMVPNFIINLIYLPNTLIFTYFISEILLPGIFFRRIKGFFIFLLIIIILIEPFFVYLIRVNIVEPHFLNKNGLYSFYNFLSAMVIFVFGATPIVSFKIGKWQKQAILRQAEIEHAKLDAELKLKEAELKLLRMQLHPHFLFNTLNNLYSLSVCKSEKTPEIIIKISDLLNYIIYECHSEKVWIEKEIEFLKSYIELEKIRFDDNLKISFSIQGDFKGKKIAPMILHTFVENSFKHGAGKTIASSWIDIDLNLISNLLNFQISNNKTENKVRNPNGIGIENAKKRLQLLYPGKHKIEISDNEDSFVVFIEMEL